MPEENEVLTLILAGSLLCFILFKRKEISDIPSCEVLLCAFLLFTFGWFFSIAESYFWTSFFNFIEHLLYFAGAVYLLVWVHRIKNN